MAIHVYVPSTTAVTFAQGPPGTPGVNGGPIPAGGSVGQHVTRDASGNPVWADFVTGDLSDAGNAGGAALLDGSGKIVASQITSAATPTANALVKYGPTGIVQGAAALLGSDLINLDYLNAFTASAPVPLQLTSDFTLSASSTTLVDITGLTQTVAANSKWWLSCVLASDADTTSDAKFNLSLPAGSAATGQMFGLTAGAASSTASIRLELLTATNTNIIVGGLGASVPVGCSFSAFITIGSTAGTIQMQAAQGTSQALTQHVLAGSWMFPVAAS